MIVFCILTVVMDAQIYTCVTSHRNVYTHSQTSQFHHMLISTIKFKNLCDMCILCDDNNWHLYYTLIFLLNIVENQQCWWFFEKIDKIDKCANLFCTAKWLSYTHIANLFFNILFHYLLTKSAFKHVSQNPLNYNHMRRELLISFLETGNLSLRWNVLLCIHEESQATGPDPQWRVPSAQIPTSTSWLYACSPGCVWREFFVLWIASESRSNGCAQGQWLQGFLWRRSRVLTVQGSSGCAPGFGR